MTNFHKVYIPATSNLIYIDKTETTPIPYSPFDLRIIPNWVNSSFTILTKRGEVVANDVPRAQLVVETDGVNASATFTLTSAVAGVIVTVNGLTYTGVDGAKSDNTEFSVDTSDAAAAIDLADSIANDTRVGITVPTRDVTASPSTNVVTVTSVLGGVLSNTIDTVSSAGTIVASAATLGSGTDGAAIGANMDATLLALAVMIQ